MQDRVGKACCPRFFFVYESVVHIIFILGRMFICIFDHRGLYRCSSDILCEVCVCVFLHTKWFVWCYSFDTTILETLIECVYEMYKIWNINMIILYIYGLDCIYCVLSQHSGWSNTVFLNTDCGPFMNNGPFLLFSIVLLVFSLSMALTRMLIKIIWTQINIFCPIIYFYLFDIITISV